MRLRRTRREVGWGINIAPLIDVVFLLIIFSMTVSHFTRVEAETLDLPEAREGEGRESGPPQRVVVNVRRDGRVVVGGRERSAEELGGVLDEAVGGSAASGLAVLIRADRAAPWQHVADVMAACGTRGIGRVRVSVVEPGEAKAP